MLALVVAHTKKRQILPREQWLRELVHEQDLSPLWLAGARDDEAKREQHQQSCELLLYLEPGAVYDGALTLWTREGRLLWKVLDRLMTHAHLL